MGTGKGSMDYWAARVPVSRVILELKGDIHEQIVRDAFRVAAAKLPGMRTHSLGSSTLHFAHKALGLYETIKKGDVPCMGTVRLTPDNLQKLMARKGVPIGPLHKYVKGQAAGPAPAVA